MAIASGSIAYTGTYTVDENTKTIHANVGGALFQILLKLLTSAGSFITADEMKLFTNPARLPV